MLILSRLLSVNCLRCLHIFMTERTFKLSMSFQDLTTKWFRRNKKNPSK